MSRWWNAVVLAAVLTIGLVSGCELGWDFLKEKVRGAGAQADCASSRVVIGQFPPVGGFLSEGTFTAQYSSPKFNGTTSNKALGLRISRSRLWLNDLSIEVSFFPFDNTERDSRNGCLGRAILEINIPEEDLFSDARSIDVSIDVSSTRVSQTDPSAFYAEGGDPGFTATAVTGTIRLMSIDGSQVKAEFSLTFNPGTNPRTFTEGNIDDQVDQNPAVEGLQQS
jgi:hypothetical protein